MCAEKKRVKEVELNQEKLRDLERIKHDQTMEQTMKTDIASRVLMKKNKQKEQLDEQINSKNLKELRANNIIRSSPDLLKASLFVDRASDEEHVKIHRNKLQFLKKMLNDQMETIKTDRDMRNNLKIIQDREVLEGDHNQGQLVPSKFSPTGWKQVLDPRSQRIDKTGSVASLMQHNCNASEVNKPTGKRTFKSYGDTVQADTIQSLPNNQNQGYISKGYPKKTTNTILPRNNNFSKLVERNLTRSP